MATSFVRHTVADFAVWKRGYDAAETLQKENGVLAESVHRDADDPSVVVVVHKFQDVASANRFFSLDALKETMKELGVQGAPTIWICDDVD